MTIMIFIEILSTPPNNIWWQQLICLYLKFNIGNSFSIHCWNDELKEIYYAKQFGTAQSDQWKYGTIISGKINEKFIDFVISSSKDLVIQHSNDIKMTPFFNIFLDNQFYSSHYGTEINITTHNGLIDRELFTIIQSIENSNWAIVHYD